MSTNGWVSSGVLVAVISALLYVLLAGAPNLPVGVANGSYANPCCGTLILNNGQMTIGNQYVSYVVERDKGGPYVLPQALVAVTAGNRLNVSRGSQPLKLRLDSEHPRRIELPGSEASYGFERQNN
jgi:hypothetical protein